MAKLYLAAALALATASALEVSHVLIIATTARSMSLAGPGMARPQPEQRLLLAAERGQIAPQFDLLVLCLFLRGSSRRERSG